MPTMMREERGYAVFGLDGVRVGDVEHLFNPECWVARAGLLPYQGRPAGVYPTRRAAVAALRALLAVEP